MVLPRGRWSPESHAKLTSFLERAGGSGGHALFDADNTVWTGDLGDATLVYLAGEVRLSERVADLLPDVIDVPAGRFGLDAPGRLFPGARLREATAVMRARADMSSFRASMLEPGGALHDDAAFREAHAAYRGTLFATYTLLETDVGCVAFEPNDPARRTVDALSWFPEDARAFFGDALPWRAMLDTGPDQRRLARAGKLGAYSQIALWEGLDKTPEELEAIGLEVWERVAPDTPSSGTVAIDVADASSPERDTRLGAATMLEGTALRPEIVDLFAAMRARDITPVVVTASQVDLVRAVIRRHYGGGEPVVVGMQADRVDGRYAASLRVPATYGPGKVDAARALASVRPVFAAGDTNTDLEMLAYADGARLFFDRGKRPFMNLADHLLGSGHGGRTIVQTPW